MGFCTTAIALASVVALAGLLAVAPAWASGTWQTPVTLASEAEEARFGPYVAMGGAGEGAAVWSGADNEALRSVGGRWGAAGSLSGEAGDVSGPCLAMSSTGEAIAVWSAVGETSHGIAIETAARAPGGQWGTPVQLLETGEPIILSVRDCKLALDAAGDAVAVWAEETEFEFEEVWAAYRPAGGAWQAPVELHQPGNIDTAPSVAIDSKGDAQAVWVGTSYAVEGQYKPAGEDWRKPESPTEVEKLSESGHTALDPSVAFDAAGEALVVWDVYDEGDDVVQAAQRAQGGAWQAAQDLSSATENAWAPSMAMSSPGEALAVWEHETAAGHYAVEGASRSAAGHWEAPMSLSPAGDNARFPSLAVNASGAAVAAWEQKNGESFSVQGALRPAGGAWQPPAGISTAVKHGELFPQVAIDTAGDALVAWELDDEGSYLMQAAAFEPLPQWYSDGAIIEKGTPESVVGSGPLTIQLTGAAVTCKVRAEATIENPLDAGAGVDEVTGFSLSGCKATSALCARGEKLEATAMRLPWAGELLAGSPTRDELSHIELGIDCSKHKLASTYDALDGALAPQVGDSVLDFASGSGELSQSRGGSAAVTGVDKLKGPKKDRQITADEP